MQKIEKITPMGKSAMNAPFGFLCSWYVPSIPSRSRHYILRLFGANGAKGISIPWNKGKLIGPHRQADPGREGRA
jgi:hypothetical protein